MTISSRPRRKLFTKDIVVPAIWASFRKLDPRVQLRNPVMFVVEVGSVITTGIFLSDLFRGRLDGLWFTGVVAFWLWLTVVFANLAEAIAEGRGKAQANALRATRSEMTARRLDENGREETVPAAHLSRGDLVVCEAGDLIPGDGDVIEGVASVDESAITGESAPVIRESGGDRSAVTGGTGCCPIASWCASPRSRAASFLDRMIALVEGTSRRKTPNEIALNILIAGLTIVFLVVTAALRPMVALRGHRGVADGPHRPAGGAHPHDDRRPAVGHRHRRHGPPRAAQRAGHERSRGRGRRRRRHAAARQDRHDHARQPPGDGVHPGGGRRRARPRRRGPARLPRRRDPRGPLDRGARQGALRPPRARGGRARPGVHPLQRRDAHERRADQRHEHPQGRLRRHPGVGGRARRRLPGRPPGVGRRGGARGRHPARGGARRAGPGRDPPEGRGQGGDDPALRPSCAGWASARS